MDIFTGTVLENNVYLRNEPGGAEMVGTLHKNDRIKADDQANQWLHITEVNGVVMTREAWASAGTRGQYISGSWVTFEPPPPPPPPDPEPVQKRYTMDVKIYEDGVLVRQMVGLEIPPL